MHLGRQAAHPSLGVEGGADTALDGQHSTEQDATFYVCVSEGRKKREIEKILEEGWGRLGERVILYQKFA